MKYQRNVEINTRGDSRTISVLMTLYMCSVLLFSTNMTLNVISQSLFVLAFGGCSAYMMMHSKNFKFEPFLITLILFVGFCFIGLLWSYDRSKSISKILTLVQLFALSLVMFSYISNYDNIDVFIRSLFISGLMSSWVVIGYYGFDEFMQLMLAGVRLGGPINNENSIGMYGSITVIISFYYGYIRKKPYAYILMLLPVLVTFGSGSRKALVMAVMGIGLLIFMKYRNNMNLKGFGKLIIAICILIIIVYIASQMPIFDTVFSRMKNMLDMGIAGKRDSSTLIRERMIDVGLEYFKSHPYTGVGIGNSDVITKERLGWGTYLHNNYVELLASVGIFGTAIFYTIYIYLLKNLYKIFIRTGSDTAILMFSIIMTQLVMEYGMVTYYDKMTYIYFAMAAATISVENHKIERGMYDYAEEDLQSLEESEADIVGVAE